MPILNLLDYPCKEWPTLLVDVMLDPVAAPGGALFDAMEADVLLLKKRGHRRSSVRNHMLLRARQLRSGTMWRGVAAGYVLVLTLVKAEAGEKRTGVNAALSDLQPALEKRLGWGNGGGISELKAAWRDFRPTAHLWARQSMGPMGELCDDLPLFLEWIAGAEDLRRRGEAFRPPKAKPPVLDPGTTWRMPDELVLPSATLELPSVDTIISKIESGS